MRKANTKVDHTAGSKSGEKTLNPALAGFLLAGAGFLAILLLGRANDAEELLSLGGYVRDKIMDVRSFDLTVHSALIAGLIPGAILWSIVKKDFSFSVMPEGNSGKISSLLACAVGGLAGGVLMMAGIRVSGISLFMALQNAVLLSGKAAVFIFAAACSAFFTAMLLKRLGGEASR